MPSKLILALPLLSVLVAGCIADSGDDIPESHTEFTGEVTIVRTNKQPSDFLTRDDFSDRCRFVVEAIQQLDQSGEDSLSMRPGEERALACLQDTQAVWESRGHYETTRFPIRSGNHTYSMLFVFRHYDT